MCLSHGSPHSPTCLLSWGVVGHLHGFQSWLWLDEGSTHHFPHKAWCSPLPQKPYHLHPIQAKHFQLKIIFTFLAERMTNHEKTWKTGLMDFLLLEDLTWKLNTSLNIYFIQAHVTTFSIRINHEICRWKSVEVRRYNQIVCSVFTISYVYKAETMERRLQEAIC